MVTTDAEHKFWAYRTGSSKYEELAKMVERNIERTHPREGYPCDALPIEYGHCSYCATAVDYYEYRGPRPTSVES